jgi:hypothetical protein
MADAGLTGLEVAHPDHDQPTRTRMSDLARRLGLLATGSSDDHGALTGHRLGVCTTDPEVWEAMSAMTSPPRSGVSSAPSPRP